MFADDSNFTHDSKILSSLKCERCVCLDPWSDGGKVVLYITWSPGRIQQWDKLTAFDMFTTVLKWCKQSCPHSQYRRTVIFWEVLVSIIQMNPCNSDSVIWENVTNTIINIYLVRIYQKRNFIGLTSSQMHTPSYLLVIRKCPSDIDRTLVRNKNVNDWQPY